MQRRVQPPIPNLRILVAPSGFKECLLADRVAAAIAAGVRAAAPGSRVTELPLVDGGEGFAAALARTTNGRIETVSVKGPLGARIDAQLGWLGANSKTAIIEIAQAAGLRLVPRDARNPMRTSSYGVGQLIRAALDRGATRLLIGCGDSGVHDGGAGMMQALGVRFLDSSGHDIARGCAGLETLHAIDSAGLDPRLADMPIDTACNVTTQLLGPQGAAHLYGPQKGADQAMVARMEAGMTRLAALLSPHVGTDIGALPGAGASGGLGASLIAFLKARMHPRGDVVFRYFDLDARLDDADLVITAEGGLDRQTPNGKIPAEVARRAKARGLPVLVLAGHVEADARLVYAHGVDAFFSTCLGPCELDGAMRDAEAHLALAAENLIRTILAGASLRRPRAALEQNAA